MRIPTSFPYRTGRAQPKYIIPCRNITYPEISLDSKNQGLPHILA